MALRPVVIVIEDQTQLGHVIRDVLDQEGYDVVAVRDQYGAIGLMRERPVDLVVADLPRPESGSGDPLGELAGEFPDMPLVVVNDPENEPVPFFSAWRVEGNRATLRRPFKLDDLVGAARDLIG